MHGSPSTTLAREGVTSSYGSDEVSDPPSPSATPRDRRGRIRPGAALALVPRALVDAALTLAAFAVTAPLAASGMLDPGVTGTGATFSDGPALVAALVAVAALLMVGGYGGSTRQPVGFSRLAAVAIAAVFAGWVLGARTGHSFDILQTALIVLTLPAAWWAVRVLAPRPTLQERALLLGSGEVAEQILEALARDGSGGLRVTGVLTDRPPVWKAPRTAPPRLGDIDALDPALDSGAFDRVLVAFTGRPDEEIARALRSCDLRGIPVSVVPRLFELVGPSPDVVQVGSLAMLDVGRRLPGRVEAGAKRALDIVGSTALLVVLSPLLAAVAAAVMIDDGRPIIFRQRRVGLRGRPFNVWKFRTMVRDADALGDRRIAGLAKGEMSLGEAVAALKQPDDPRITRLGRFLRATSLDELPQLVNVVLGDMSLVGPRPLRDFEVRSLDSWERMRNDVRPGITGLWQVQGRSDVGWEERVQLDCSYVRNQSLLGDVRLLVRTVRTVLSRQGAV